MAIPAINRCRDWLSEGIGWTVPVLADAIKAMCARWKVGPHGVADDAIFARLTERQRLANLAAERAEAVETARYIIDHPYGYSDDLLEFDGAIYDEAGAPDTVVEALRKRD